MAAQATITIKANNLTQKQFDQLTGDLKKLDRQLDRTGKNTGGFNKSVGGLGGKLGKFGAGIGAVTSKLGAWGLAGTAVAGVTIGLGKSVVTAAAKMDDYRRTLTALEGSAEVAEERFKRLQDIAQLPGISLDQAIQGAIRLKAIGVEARLAEKTITELGNAMAIAGNTDLIGAIQFGIQQIISRGKVQQEELNSLVERIPQISAVLKDLFNTTDAEKIQKNLEETGKSATDFVRLLTEALSKGVRAPADTATNAFSNFNNAMLKVKDSIGQLLLPAVTKIINALSAFLDKTADLINGLREGEKQTEAFAFAIDVLKVATVVLRVSWEYMHTLIKGVITGFKLLGAGISQTTKRFPALGKVADAVRKTFELLAKGIDKIVEGLRWLRGEMDKVDPSRLKTIAGIQAEILRLENEQTRAFNARNVKKVKALKVEIDALKEKKKVLEETAAAEAKAKQATATAQTTAQTPTATAQTSHETQTQHLEKQTQHLEKQKRVVLDTIKVTAKREKVFLEAIKVTAKRPNLRQAADNELRQSIQEPVRAGEVRRGDITLTEQPEIQRRIAASETTPRGADTLFQAQDPFGDDRTEQEREADRARYIQRQETNQIQQRHVAQLTETIKPIAQQVAQVPIDLVSALKDAFVDIPEQAQKALSTLNQDTARQINEIRNSTVMSAREKAREIEEIERNAAQKRIDIERNASEQKKQAFASVVSNFIAGIGKMIAEQAKLRLATAITNKAVAVASGGSISGGISSLGGLIGSGAGIAALASNPVGLAVGAGAGLYFGGKALGLFDDPFNDKLARQAGFQHAFAQRRIERENAGARSAEDFIREHSIGMKEGMRQQSGLSRTRTSGGGDMEVVIKNEIRLDDSTVQALEEKRIKLQRQGRI